MHISRIYPYMVVSKVGDRKEGSLYNSYYTKV